MDNLILSMITSYNEYGNDIFLGFNKNDIDNFIKKYNYLDNIHCNERGYIVLWKNKYIDNKKFEKYMDIEFKDNKLYIVCDGFDDIFSNGYDTEIGILTGELDWMSYDSYDNDIGMYYWSDYNEDTIKDIYAFCIKKGLDIEDEVMTEDNTKIENGDILFNGVSLKKYIDDENGLSELYLELNNAIISAQESADQNEMYDIIRNKFVNEIGNFEWKDKKLYIEINENIINEAEEFLIDDYGEYDFEKEQYGSLLYILKEMEKFEIRFPDLDNIYATIDEDLLNEYTQENLNF